MPPLTMDMLGGKHHTPPRLPVYDASSFPSASVGHQPFDSPYDGDVFHDSFGATYFDNLDYWLLRTRSSQLYRRNKYARGVVECLVKNVVNTGLIPEAEPEASIIGLDEDFLSDWGDSRETRFEVWAKSPRLCDHQGVMNFGALQRMAEREALIEGDCLVVVRQSARFRLPTIEIVPGNKVRNPGNAEAAGREIVQGVEVDSSGRQIAFWITQKDGTSKRLAAVSPTTGRVQAWLHYGLTRRRKDTRGEPLLAVLLQSLREIDRNQASVQRKVFIESLLTIFFEKSEDKLSSLALGNSATKTVEHESASPNRRTFQEDKFLPGVYLQELQHGEKPVGFQNHGVGADFGKFEQVIVSGVAWTLQIPPSILTLAFSSNYAASQGEKDEFNVFLEQRREENGAQFCQPIYVDHLLSETLLGKTEVPGLLESRTNPTQYDIFAAWTNAEWVGPIRPSSDIVKQAKGYQLQIENGLTTRARATRKVSGQKFGRVVRKLTRENQLMADAMAPLREAEQQTVNK